MGCTPSKPAPEPLPNYNDSGAGSNGGGGAATPKPSPNKQQDDSSMKGSRRNKNKAQSPSSHNSYDSGSHHDLTGNGGSINNSQHNQQQRLENSNNATGLSSSAHRDMVHANDVGGGGGGNAISKSASTTFPTGAADDPQWVHNWKANQDILLDPADVHATIEELMARATNRLSSTEINYMLRKLRAIVRSSGAQDSNRKGAVGRILGNTNSSSAHAVQETRSIADRFHLLSSHVIRRLLPKPPPSNNSSIVTSDSVFLLLLYLHESNWDRTAEIAVSTAKKAGLEMDVNKHKPPASAPGPINPSAATVTDRDLPQGVSFHSLTFLIGLGLRGSRIQRLQLLFYILMPSKSLLKFLQDHMAGGVPTWLLEVGNDTVLSLASLSHYYWYGDAFSPTSSRNGVDKENSATDNNNNNNNNNVMHQPKRGSSLPLFVNGPDVYLFLKSILASNHNGNIEVGGGRSAGISDGSSHITGISGNGKNASPIRKSSSLGAIRRRASNQSTSSTGDELLFLDDPSVVMDRIHDRDSNGANNFVLSDYLCDDVGGASGGGTSSSSPSTSTNKSVERFLQAGPSLSDPSTGIVDFYNWAERALDDNALDAIMNRLFAHTILTTPTIEADLVRTRWKEWQETERAYWSNHCSEPEGSMEAISQTVRKMYAMTQNGSGRNNDDNSSKKPFRQTFGGIGGFDGRGGTGFGVMYCVDRKWWDEWEQYVCWSWTGDNVVSVVENNDNPHRTRQRQRPGELSTEALLNRGDDDIVAGTFGSYELMKTDLEKDIDYVLIPPGVWDVLYEIYGGGSPLPRMVTRPKNKEALTAVDERSVDISLASATPTEVELDAMASSENIVERVLRVPQQLDVETHPWILHIHLCDPQQPYRRGDAGPMSIRVMAMPDQPFWRLYAEIVVRLPFAIYKAYDSEGRGRARLWKRTDPAGPKDALSRYGPWALLCKNRFAMLPRQDFLEENDESYNEIKDNWQQYSDSASVESSGLVDGDKIMVECAILDRNGEFRWPREAAAKAGRVRRLADKDMKFRRMLRGLDDNGKLLANPPRLVGMVVDAMDASGRWYEVTIAEVQTVAADTDEEEDSVEMEHADHHNHKGSGETKQVRVDFSEHGGHSEWIDIDSDRLATAGRFTLGKSDDPPDTPPKSQTTGTNGNDGKPKVQTQIKKASADASLDNGKVCTIPGFGACGLANLGNTCYYNSAIQCISYLPLLRAYLLSAQYKAVGDLNKDNPLGTGGKLLEEFADLLRQMWSARIGEKSPNRFKAQLSKANSQFSGADQQDAQEFLNYMLDVLHEDSNRVRRKPYVEGLEDDWVKVTQLPRVGEEAWRRFLRRNRSIMTDVAMGQVLSTVTCPVCQFSSRSFDPFNLLSIPFPTVADVIFKCYIVRRATAFNSPWVLNKPRKNGKYRNRFSMRDAVSNPKPPSDQLIVEQYVIAMSRLADSGDLKLQIQNLSGIPSADLRLCRAEEFIMRDKEDTSVVRRHTQVTLLTDKEGPCSQLAQQRANTEDLGTTPAAPSLIVAFETTLKSRPPDEKRSEDESSSNGEEEEEETGKAAGQSRKELKELERDVSMYGNIEECRLYDTETLPIAKAISRSLWPTTEDELKLGLRVDAIDHREHWFPGSVVEILENGTNGESKEGEGAKTKVRIHFDNFSSKWDEMYTIDHFTEGRVRPLYSHAAPRTKPTEFAVHHRYTDRISRMSNLFGQTFYVQCHNEWSTARAGAQILSQASRFLRQASDSPGPVDLDDSQERDAKIQRLYDRTQAVISDLIDLLVDCDREYVHFALGIVPDPNSTSDAKVEKFRNPGFDATALSSSLVKRVNALLHRLPFEVRVCTVDSPLGGTNEEVAFPFSLMRTIGNYMNARHAVVLQWREPPSDKKTTGGGRHSNYLGAPVMYVPPRVSVDEISAEILNKANQKAKRTSTTRGSAGLQLGVCLTEFCKVQQLSVSDNWRCPRCKDYREGKQNLTLWRLPDLLTFHIKRFNCSARWREKITTKVNFPLSGLDMTEWCHKESPVIQTDSKDSHVYDLIGVLNHYGGMTGGHYVATCKATACGREGFEEVAYDFNGSGTSSPVAENDDPDVQTGWKFGRQKAEVNSNKVTAASTAKAAAESAEPLWLQFDDDLVEPIPPRYVVSEMAYVLFYRRRRMTPSNIARYSTLE